MNQELWQKIGKLRSLPFSGSEGLAEFFQKEGIRFAAKDLGTWGKFLAARFGRSGGAVHVPEWLAGVFCALAKDVSPKSICDPWAGIGFLIEALREECQPDESIAFTQVQGEHELGKILVADVKWQHGEPLHLLDAVTQEFDVVASILPMGARSANPLNVTATSGDNLELRDDLGNLVMVVASLRLSSSGVGFFVVTPSFFFSQRSVFRNFSNLGLGVQAALALPSGTFAPYTNIPSFLLVVGRKPAARMFVAQLSGDEKTNLQILDNLRQGHEGGTLELGRFVDPLTFTSLETIRTAERFGEAERHFAAPAAKPAELATAINLCRFGEDVAFPPPSNSLVITLLGNRYVVGLRAAYGL